MLSESCDNVGTLQVQLSPLQRHRFCLQSSLTPQNQWTTPDGYKVGARFVFKFKKPIPLRYGAMKQLKTVTDGLIVQDSYVNAYKSISHKKYKRDVLLNLSNCSKRFFMFFNFDKYDDEAENDTIINGFYLEKASEIISAMYIIKREYILNKLCESTCEDDPHMVELYQQGINNNKIPMYVRLAEVGNGRMMFYFRYRCYLTETTLEINPVGHVTIANMRLVHHGNTIDMTYKTVSTYRQMVDHWELANEVIPITTGQHRYFEGIIKT